VAFVSGPVELQQRNEIEQRLELGSVKSAGVMARQKRVAEAEDDRLSGPLQIGSKDRPAVQVGETPV
jgi:hypothetical protein